MVGIDYKAKAIDLMDKLEQKLGKESSAYKEFVFGLMTIEAANDGVAYGLAALPLFKMNVKYMREYAIDQIAKKLEKATPEQIEAYDRMATSGEKSMIALYELFSAEDPEKNTTGYDNINTALALLGVDKTIKPDVPPDKGIISEETQVYSIDDYGELELSAEKKKIPTIQELVPEHKPSGSYKLDADGKKVEIPLYENHEEVLKIYMERRAEWIKANASD